MVILTNCELTPSHSHNQQRQLNLMPLHSVMTANYHEAIQLVPVTIQWPAVRLKRHHHKSNQSLLCYLEKFDFLRGFFSENYSNGLGIVNRQH